MDRFNISILEYLGKYESGIMVLISIVYDNIYYEGTYFYTNTDLVLTVPEELENILGHVITEDSDYPSLIKYMIKNIVPYNEMVNRLDDIDFNRWITGEIEYESGEEAKNIDEDDIKKENPTDQ